MHLLCTEGQGSVVEADAYALLGLPQGATGSDVKKKYMRLSLLVHPDKCSHKWVAGKGKRGWWWCACNEK